MARVLTSQGYATTFKPSVDGIAIVATGGDPTAATHTVGSAPDPAAGTKIMVMVAADRLGSGDDGLGAKQVGTTTNMLDIVTAMQLADKVIAI